jgi:hypothetical protein
MLDKLMNSQFDALPSTAGKPLAERLKEFEK